MSENWVEGSYEAGADADEATSGPLNSETGVGLSVGEPSTFEPVEDAASGEPASSTG